MRHLTAWLILVSVWFAADLVAGEAPAEPPNLLVIQTDEHHYGTLGCYGGKIVSTPHLDGLARSGALCTSFYATTPVCSPSRAAFVSGRYPQNTPVVTNNIPLDDDIVTFGELLRRRGYATGYAGKWHLDGTGKPQWAPKRKFGFEDNRYMFNRGHWKKLEETPDGPRVAARNARGKPTYSVEGADETSFTTDWLASRTIDFIRRHADRPFCFMVCLPDPHGPNTVRAPYDTMFARTTVPVPASLNKTPAQTPGWARPDPKVNARMIRRLQPAYYGMVKCIDDNVGRVLKVLKERGLLERTVVVFTADHGDLCGEHGRFNKGVPYEGSARIPFILHYPKRVKPGTVVRQALSCVDFLPTLAALMGFETTGREQGRDASRLFTQQGGADWNDIAFLRSTPGNEWLCAVTDRYKLVYSKADRPWLFDLSRDPHELDNRFVDPSYQETVRRMTHELARYAERFGDPYAGIPSVAAGIERALRP